VRFALVRKLLALSLFLGMAGLPDWSEAADSTFRILSHDLKVTIVPSSHRLMVMDRVVLQPSHEGQKRIALTLNKKLVVAWISQNGKLLPFHPREAPAEAPDPATGPSGLDPRLAHEIVIDLDQAPKAGQTLVLDFDYAGELNDPPREPRHLRFVTPSETSGHIGSEGVYIGPETAWYPDLPHSLATYRASVSTPSKWETAGQGKLVSREATAEATITTWETVAPSEGLTLSAGQYLISTRRCGEIDIATYFYPEEAGLAETYLTSACTYLRSYAKLLGAYPFPRFSIVENFFPSGLGMPSYTLLGAGSIRRRYIQPYALGHEIVHSWIGNYVYNNDDGNWVEGLTTYLANYYWYELEGDPKKARDERRMMLLAYAVYVPADRDYPIARFKQKADQRDSAIGYSKAAMVFHMLRREIGDAPFFGALKQLVAQYGGRRAGWQELELLFSKAASRDLRPFFSRWIEQPGALALPASSDPDYQLFRRIPRGDLPAMLNLFVTDPQRLVVLPGGDSNTLEPYREIAARLSQEDSVKVRSIQDLEGQSLQNSSILLLGGPAVGASFEWVRRALPSGTDLRLDGFRVDAKEYRGEGMALLLSVRNPDNPSHIVTLFYGLTPDAVKPVAPLLFYYGWNTYVIFDNGKVVVRGDEEPRRP